ncbi:hypothetical protein [Glutamicibacter sp. NPDC127525]|uniref:hypothetical protein n=1 Tax=unclassified Glutamicibacter TaxID=2627139 RepID=UPI00364086F2
MTEYPRRNIERYKKPVQTFTSLNEFLHAEHIKPGIISISGALPIDLLYSPANSSTTVVSFHAALTKAETPLPMFAGAKVSQDGPVNRIFIADSGLYAGSEHKIAWFAGTRELDFQKQLPKIIDKLLVQAGGTRTLFWGPSAGGFAALYYSKLFPDSLAVAINPQTIIANFGLANQRAYTEAAFGTETQEQHEEALATSFNSNLLDWYDGQVPNYILYVQNESDNHVQNHMEPFLSSLDDQSRVRIHMGNWGQGHVAPSPEEIRQIIASFTLQEGGWGEVLANFTPPVTVSR